MVRVRVELTTLAFSAPRSADGDNGTTDTIRDQN